MSEEKQKNFAKEVYNNGFTLEILEKVKKWEKPEIPTSPSTIKLHGWVKDQSGNPIPSGVRVIDQEWKEIGNGYTTEKGYFELTIPGRERFSVSITPHVSSPQHYVEIKGGFRVSRYFGLTKTIIPTRDKVEVDFVLPPAAALWIRAYSPEGNRLQMGDLYSQLNPPFWGFEGIFGAFPMDSSSLPLPAGRSIGMLRAAWHPKKVYSQWEPYFAVPPGEAVYLMMLWPVPNIGTIPLRADNRGQGYNLKEGKVLPLNIVYEFAETEYRRAVERKSSYEVQRYHLSTDVEDWLSQASDYLNEARGGQADGKSRALLSYKVLELSIKAKEHMTLEVAEVGIERRYNDLTVAVQDEVGNPVPEAKVTYGQSGSDFVLGYGNYLPFGAFLYPSFKAGKEMGFEFLYDQASTWAQVSPKEGVYDFTVHDAALERARVEGWEAVSNISFLGIDNVPAWAKTLEFSEFKRHLREYVKKEVEHFRGKVKYLIVVQEPTIQTIIGSRYVDVQFESSYDWGVQPDELIELIRTVFEAAREVDSGILLGYSVDPDYGPYQLNPLNFGSRPCPYAFLKSVLESGVRPDWIGVEFQSGVGHVPLDLSTVAAIIQAYHDLSGLPVLITEMPSYPSRTEDYGLTGPAPDVYWHEGMTQSVQAEWATSVSRIAMGLPYVLGLQMMHNQPDNYAEAPREGTGNGTDYLTNDYRRKQVYSATKDLFDSWRAHGSAVADANGKVNFDGFGGTYSIGVTTVEGLLHTFETHLGPESKVVTVKLDRAKALADLQHLVAQAQKAVDWSQKLGRELDYNSLRSRLAEARSAIANGDYGSARTITELILDAITIKIDGNPGDWKSIQPIATAPPGGVQVDAPGIDLKALYGMRDDEYLYLMVEVYDPPITLQPGGIIGGVSFPQFLFDLETGQGRRHHLRTYLPYTGQMDIYNLTGPAQILATLYTIAYGKVLELRVPLALLDNPSRVSVCAFVMAAEDGKEKVAKAFECDVQVIYP
ncbi:MAG: endo-1,4-beta-xylanase [Desulfobacterales bacterium]|nr:endo-1,4-beta-xylanase [Desulfobacterales bacterium]